MENHPDDVQAPVFVAIWGGTEASPGLEVTRKNMVPERDPSPSESTLLAIKVGQLERSLTECTKATCLGLVTLL